MYSHMIVKCCEDSRGYAKCEDKYSVFKHYELKITDRILHPQACWFMSVGGVMELTDAGALLCDRLPQFCILRFILSDTFRIVSEGGPALGCVEQFTYIRTSTGQSTSPGQILFQRSCLRSGNIFRGKTDVVNIKKVRDRSEEANY